MRSLILRGRGVPVPLYDGISYPGRRWGQGLCAVRSHVWVGGRVGVGSLYCEFQCIISNGHPELKTLLSHNFVDGRNKYVVL